MNEEFLKMIYRVKASPDGPDLMEFFKNLSVNNYTAFKRAPSDFNDVHKGQAIALDGIIEVFDTCEEKLRQLEALAVAQKAESETGVRPENPWT